MRLTPTLTIATALTLLLTLAGHAQTRGDAMGSRPVRQVGMPSSDVASVKNDSLFRRAERLVRDGHGETGRALVDTLLAGTQPGTPEHGQALYWRASLAADAAQAERGYRRVIVEYPATRWAGNALLNLAQLELARGDQEQSLVHLRRFEREYPSHDSRARAAFWLARLYFDRKNEPRGCAALATARVASSPEDIELRNQIDYYGQRCIGVDTALVALPRPAVAASSTAATPVAPTPVTTTSRTADPSRSSSGVPSSQRNLPAADSTPREQIGKRGHGGYTVQVAAFGTRAGAEALVERLKARGYPARLASSASPFRVRLGQYDTRADAAAAQRALKAKGIDGFVIETEQ
jgi:cell division septation protein DedD